LRAFGFGFTASITSIGKSICYSFGYELSHTIVELFGCTTKNLSTNLANDAKPMQNGYKEQCP
jgi:hypothetical protein